MQLNPNEKIKRLRALMTENGIDACVIPSDDPHQSEYVAEHWQARKWLTGFTGSAGTAVVTQDRALLWTDSRYFIQAYKQIETSGFELMKIGEPHTPTYEKWLRQHLKKGDTVGIDGQVFSVEVVKKMKKELDQKQITLNTRMDFICSLWDGRPAIPCSAAYEFSSRYTGIDRKEKIALIREKLTEADATFHLMTSLDDIAWTFNLRGNDVHASPVNIAFATISHMSVDLFILKSKLNRDLTDILEKDSIHIHDYEDILEHLAALSSGQTILLSESRVNHRLYDAINPSCNIINQPNPGMLLKSIKNRVEIKHIRDTMIKDGVALTNFLYWLESRIDEETITELSAGNKVFELRSSQPDFVANSFDTIMAFQDHSPICHYSATTETDYPIRKPGMFLMDSGGNYLTGTTDITRTIYLGNPPPEAISDYTLVLKGHIAVARAVFPQGTKGFQLDTFARQFMWPQGINFGHGTGHGVGFFLNVHEGPSSISPHPVDNELKPGMLLTNEPGIYRENKYGIRIENMILVQEDIKTDFGQFLSFENLTLCHYEIGLIDKALLDEHEINWINSYHEKLRKILSERLEPPVRKWFHDKTRAI